MSTNAWDTASRLADKHANQGGIFIRLAANGDKVVGAFCGEPFAREVVWTGERYETYDPAVHTDKRPSLRVMLNFFVPDEDDMKVIEGGTVWFKDVLKVRDKYGLDKWLFEIERHGDAGDPKMTYSILPEEKIDDAMRARIAEVEPHDLASICSGDASASADKGAAKPSAGGSGGAIDPRVASELVGRLRVLEVRRRRAVLWGAQARLDAMQARRALADIGHAAVMRLGNPRKAARFIMDAGTADNG